MSKITGEGRVRAATWQLVDAKTGRGVSVGDERTTFRGDRVVVIGLAAPHAGSSGRVFVQTDHGDCEYFPSVIGAVYRPVHDQEEP